MKAHNIIIGLPSVGSATGTVLTAVLDMSTSNYLWLSWFLINLMTSFEIAHRILTHWPLGNAGIILKSVIFELISTIDILRLSSEIALKWMSHVLADDWSVLVEVMAWCCQATSNHLSQYWPSSMVLSGITMPQWVNVEALMKYSGISYSYVKSM